MGTLYDEEAELNRAAKKRVVRRPLARKDLKVGDRGQKDKVIKKGQRGGRI